MAIRPNRVKSAFIQLRVTPSDREIIRRMAEAENLGLTEFILARVWGEAPKAKSEPTIKAMPTKKKALDDLIAAGLVTRGVGSSVAPRSLDGLAVADGDRPFPATVPYMGISREHKPEIADDAPSIAEVETELAENRRRQDKPKRPFNPRRRDWYNSEGTDVEWAQICEDVETHQWWLVASGKGQEYPSRQACREALEGMR